MKGTILKREGAPHFNSIRIEGEDGKEYIAHLGDMKICEDKLYELNTKDDKFIAMQNSMGKGDLVEFEPFNSDLPHAIHVKKINN